MIVYNSALPQLRRDGRLTLGIMSPGAPDAGGMADLDHWLGVARQADALGFGALWVRDVPLMVPQGSENRAVGLDDPFLWLAAMAAVTERIALGTAAAVLPLRHPIHLAKSTLTLERISRGRLVLGLGSGDRAEEFASFGESLEGRGESFRQRWDVLCSALDPDPEQRRAFMESTGGYDVMPPPDRRIPLVVVGSSRQTLQWIAQRADGWATYFRDTASQVGRFDLWKQAVVQKTGDASSRMLIQSMQLQLDEDPQAPARPISLGLGGGRNALRRYFGEAKNLGVDHVILSITPGPRPLDEVVQELGEEVIPYI